jgi:PAS domain-containing protein
LWSQWKKMEKFNIDIKILVFTVTASVITGLATVYSVNTNDDTNRIDILWKQAQEDRVRHSTEMMLIRAENTKLQGRVLEGQVSLAKAQIQIMKLNAALQINTDIQGFIESLPFPAWIKRPEEDGIFRMAYINDEYTSAFGITKKEYIGFTDFDLHSEDVATTYVARDAEVISSNRDLKEYGYIEVKGVRLQILIVLFPIKLPDGDSGIGGMVIEINQPGEYRYD